MGDVRISQWVVTNRRKNGGYALLWVILLAAFLSILLLMIGVDTKLVEANSSKSKLKFHAKNNAIFALRESIFVLQKFLGPDDRITVPSRRLNGNSSNDVAVFKVFRGRGDVKFSNEKLCILSSNSYENVNETVKIFDKNNENIFVKLVNICNDAGETCGRYAYFIDDESQKSSLTVSDYYHQDGSSRARYVKQTCSQRCGVEFCNELNEIYAPNLYIYRKIDFVDQMRYIDERYSNLESFLRNFSINSYGVISSIIDKSLRKDLTCIFLSDNQSNIDIFQVPDDFPVKSPKLSLLQSFANFSGEVTPNYPVFRPQEDSIGGGYEVSRNHGFFPVLVKFVLKIGVKNVSNEVCVTFSPEITIWNPYNADMIVKDACIKAYASSNLNIDVKYSTGGGTYSVFNKSAPLCMKFGDIKVVSGCVYNVTGSSIDVSTGINISNLNEASELIIAFKNPSNWEFFHLLWCQLDEILQDFYCCLAKESNHLTYQSEFRFDASDIANLDSCLATINSRIAGVGVSDFSEFDCVRAMANGNIRSTCVNFLLNTKKEETGGPPWAPQISESIAIGNIHFVTHINCGDSVRFSDFSDSLNSHILYDVPMYGVPNVGFLRHVNFAPTVLSPAYSLCDSDAQPWINVDKNFFANNSSSIYKGLAKYNAVADVAFLTNDVMFDKYFCSTFDGEDTINKRFKVLDDEQCFCAKNMLISSPFNVNSDSKCAWVSALSGNINEDCANYYRVFDDKFCKKLSSAEINLIADNLIYNICNSKNFATVGEFVNRHIPNNLEDPCKFVRKGVLQNAIDSSLVNSGKKVEIESLWNGFDVESANGALNEDWPNFLNQGDLIAPMSHFLTSRGDTFLVRAYGDVWSEDKNKILSHAICEALVQRVPNFLNTVDLADSEFDVLSDFNKQFGRRFKIILFRWVE